MSSINRFFGIIGIIASIITIIVFLAGKPYLADFFTEPEEEKQDIKVAEEPVAEQHAPKYLTEEELNIFKTKLVEDLGYCSNNPMYIDKEKYIESCDLDDFSFEPLTRGQREYEFFALKINTFAYCGSGGCSAVVVKKRGKEYKEILSGRSNFRLSQNRTNGVYDLISFHKLYIHTDAYNLGNCSLFILNRWDGKNFKAKKLLYIQRWDNKAQYRNSELLDQYNDYLGKYYFAFEN